MATTKRKNKGAAFRAMNIEYEDYLEQCRLIRAATEGSVPHNETAAQQSARKARLLADINAFARHYFPHLTDADLAWFHRRAHRKLLALTGKHVWQWPRAHAKSTFALIEVMHAHARGDLRGVVLASANADKAAMLVSDLRAQYEGNALWIHDYGDMRTHAEWRDDYFATSDGNGFWALGRGQSPRGVKKSGRRPNLLIVDDIDDKVICRNQERVRQARDWVLEDLYGCIDIKHSGALVVVGNRIHPQSILAHVVGDISPEHPVDPSVNYVLAFMTEDPRARSHAKDKGPGRVPAWKERYTVAMTDAIRANLGARASDREHYHEHHEEGLVFKHSYIQYGKRPTHFDAITAYCDPSWKDTKASDTKAWVTVGRTSNPQQYWILDIWCRRASTSAMVRYCFDLQERFGPLAHYYIEAILNQDVNFRNDFVAEADARQVVDYCRFDYSSRGNKTANIESLEPLFERGQVWFDEDIARRPDTLTFLNQLHGFPFGNDDGPDALHGSITNLAKGARSLRILRSGQYSDGDAARSAYATSPARSRGRRLTRRR